MAMAGRCASSLAYLCSPLSNSYIACMHAISYAGRRIGRGDSGSNQSTTGRVLFVPVIFTLKNDYFLPVPCFIMSGEPRKLNAGHLFISGV